MFKTYISFCQVRFATYEPYDLLCQTHINDLLVTCSLLYIYIYIPVPGRYYQPLETMEIDC